MIYRFKIRFEDEEDFLSVVEVSTQHSFYHLHDIMQTAIGFNKKQEAAIFTTNDNWKPLKEISIPSDYTEAIHIGESLPLISKHIFDPYQKFLYLADKANEWVLEVELMRIDNDEPKVVYPRVKRTEGFAPSQFVAAPIIDDADVPKEDFGELPPMPNMEPNKEEINLESNDLNLNEFPDLGDIDEIDFSEEV